MEYVNDWAQYRRGKRMKRPLNSSMEAYKIMKDCWNNDPLRRPTFSELVKDFENIRKLPADHWCNATSHLPASTNTSKGFIATHENLFYAIDLIR